jgi:hypothetical protein
MQQEINEILYKSLSNRRFEEALSYINSNLSALLNGALNGFLEGEIINSLKHNQNFTVYSDENYVIEIQPRSARSSKTDKIYERPTNFCFMVLGDPVEVKHYKKDRHNKNKIEHVESCLLAKGEPLYLKKTSVSSGLNTFEFSGDNYLLVLASLNDFDKVSSIYSKKNLKKIANISNCVYESRSFMWLKYCYDYSLKVDLEVLQEVFDVTENLNLKILILKLVSLHGLEYTVKLLKDEINSNDSISEKQVYGVFMERATRIC